MSFVFEAEVRSDLGKGASRRLRHEDKVPAIVYGAGQEPVAIALDHKKVNIAQADDAFYSEVLTLVINGQEVKVKAQDIQRHPYKPKLTHLDFVRA
ncbi:MULTISPECIES: 50S ribosomal protein L25 [Oceanimonas]|uniref:Large ribosomal subunit protein bL25 n=1 Tax=Oceanimonas doudoroffii TaxID=84158 RepID=A0A233RHM1_9GAMM|nr:MULTISPECIES: 50S ribosomal protein L25 [Oceanimonas]NHI00510.1 50S ribosomal protein L25 [Oceanimonas sp. MB9]OXY82885.1 50S ribosomal protein L25 [Oceanimonas doudoroffii]